MEIPDWLQDIWQSLLKDWIKYGVAAVGGVIITWARSKNWRWATPVLYGLLAFAAIYILLGGWSKPAQLTSTSPQVETNIRKWLDNFHLRVQKVPENDSYFTFIIQTPNGQHVKITRSKTDQDQYITFNGAVVISADDQVKLKTLPTQKQRQLQYELIMELTRQKISNSINFPENVVVVETRAPIIELTEAKLIEQINDIDYAVALVRTKFRSSLDFN
jgi:hypothetical protein